MIRKRLIGVISIRDGRAVQSFGFNRYLPLGTPECLAENLDRWGADEILIQIIDRSTKNLGPNLDLVQKIANSKIVTPLIYGGGISSAEDSVRVIRAGADRICLDTLLHTAPNEIRRIADALGAQAIIGSFPVGRDSNGRPQWYDYRNRVFKPFSSELLKVIEEGLISECLVIDFQHEGQRESFDFELLQVFDPFQCPIIPFGGLSSTSQFDNALSMPKVSAVGIGNFLNYSEHALQKIKSSLDTMPIRRAYYQKSRLVSHEQY